MFYPLLCASFCDKNGNLALNHRFLLQTKSKPADKTLEQRFLKEFKATCKNFGEVELKQQKAISKVIWVSYAPIPSIIFAQLIRAKALL